MRNILFVITFILLSCSDSQKQYITMTFSNALPVKIWRNGETVYNNLIVPGKDKTPFCQPFNATDNITIQAIDTDYASHTIVATLLVDDVAIDEILLDEVVIGVFQKTFQMTDSGITADCVTIRIEITENSEVDIPNNLFTGTLTPWTNIGTGTDWVYNSNSALATITLTPATPASDATKYLSTNNPTVSGKDYSLVLNGSIEHTSGTTRMSALKVLLGNNDFTVTQEVFSQDYELDSPSETISLAGTEVLFTPNAGYTKMGIQFIVSSGIGTASGTVDVRIDDVALTIEENVVFGYSDCLEIKASHEDTCLTKYTSTRDYAGLVYQGVSPVPEFYIRLKSQFFEPREPENDESESLSSGSVLNLSSDIKTQKMLYIEQAPDHIHKIMRRALKHSSVEITNHEETIEVTKEEKYESEIVDIRNPLFTANCWLTVKDSFETNVYTG